MPEESNLQSQMLYDALIILQSVKWVERRLKESMTALEVAESREDEKAIDRLRTEILTYIKRIDLEDKNMTDFMVKYKKLINKEKKKT